MSVAANVSHQFTKLREEIVRLERRTRAGAKSGNYQVIIEYCSLSDAIAYAERMKSFDPQIITPDGTVYFTPRQEIAFGIEIAENERRVGAGI